MTQDMTLSYQEEYTQSKRKTEDEETHMVTNTWKDVQRCWWSREMQVRAMAQYHFTSIWLAKFKNLIKPSVREDAHLQEIGWMKWYINTVKYYTAVTIFLNSKHKNMDFALNIKTQNMDESYQDNTKWKILVPKDYILHKKYLFLY